MSESRVILSKAEYDDLIELRRLQAEKIKELEQSIKDNNACMVVIKSEDKHGSGLPYMDTELLSVTGPTRLFEDVRNSVQLMLNAQPSRLKELQEENKQLRADIDATIVLAESIVAHNYELRSMKEQLKKYKGIEDDD